MKYIRLMLHGLWIFFPGVFILIIVLIAFTLLDQGRDLMTSVLESRFRTGVSMLAISFWAWITWYSSRLVANKKEEVASSPSSNGNLKSIHSPETIKLYQYFPRYLGFACFVIIQIAVLHSPLLDLFLWQALAIGLGGNTILIVIGWFWIHLENPIFERHPYSFFLFVLTGFIILSAGLIYINPITRLWFYFALLLLLGLSFLIFVYSRRVKTESQTMSDEITLPKKSSFFTVSLFLLILGILVYGFTLFSIPFSRNIGSFSFGLLAFGLLLAVGNFITWHSVHRSVNFHILAFLVLLLVGMIKDPYQLDFSENENKNQVYQNRQSLESYFEQWLADNKKLLDDPSVSYVPIYATLADGGASRSGYWVAQVLGELQDQLGNDFSKRLFCISGASGGTVGNVTFYNLLHQYIDKPGHNEYRSAAKEFLKQDFLTYTLTQMISPAYLLVNDRGAALEKSLEDVLPAMAQPFSKFICSDTTKQLPILYINTTRMQDSHPALISNIRFDSIVEMKGRLDVLAILDQVGKEINLSTAAILSSRFPYVSPAGGIENDYFVDGGYFDNSGAGAVHETLLSFENFLAKKDSSYLKKVTFNIAHIRNSKVKNEDLKRVNPIINDLAAPILVLAASYGQQTEVNTERLKYYINSRNDRKITTKKNNWHDINLYSGHENERYAMSWFMSDTCRTSIDLRVNQELDSGSIKRLKEEILGI